MRKRAALTFCLCLLSGAALAADGAKFRAIGFSPDTQLLSRSNNMACRMVRASAYTDIFILDISKR